MREITEERSKELQTAIHEYVDGLSSAKVCKKYKIDHKTLAKMVVESGHHVRSRAEVVQLMYGVNHATQKDDSTWVKVCKECGQEKSVEVFHPDKEYADGRGSICYDCKNAKRRPRERTRYQNDPEYRDKAIAESKKYYAEHPETIKAYHIKSTYGLEFEDYTKKLEEQGNCCAACGATSPGVVGRTWHVDHDHSCCSGKKKACGKCVRGLLCQPCNLILGMAKDSPETLRSLISYLEKYKRG
jgi:hypothetical protein